MIWLDDCFGRKYYDPAGLSPDEATCEASPPREAIDNFVLSIRTQRKSVVNDKRTLQANYRQYKVFYGVCRFANT